MSPGIVSRGMRMSAVVVIGTVLGLTLGSCTPSGPSDSDWLSPMIPPTTSPAPGGTDPAGQGAQPTASARPAADANRPIKRIVAQNAQVLYFTFDDGPSVQWTPKILAVLAKHHAHATFFPVRGEIEKHPDLVQQVKAAGHTVGRYAADQTDLTSLSGNAGGKGMQAAVQSRCVRAPFGAMSQQVRDVATDRNLKVVSWDVDPQDWSRPGTSKIVKSVLDQMSTGAIVLMYDGGGDRSQTVAALDQLLTKLGAKGFTFSSLDC